MSEVHCYITYEGCEYQETENAYAGRTQMNEAMLFCSLTSDDPCVKTEIDIQKLRDMGFNKFILLTNWNDDRLKQLKLHNSEVMLEVTGDDYEKQQDFDHKLHTWLESGISGLDTEENKQNFYAIFLDEPKYDTPEEQRRANELIAIAHQHGQKVAVCGFSIYYILYTMDTYDDVPGADILFYSGYNGPWNGDWFASDSDQRPFWDRFRTKLGNRPGFPFLVMSHTFRDDSKPPGEKVSYESYTDVDYLDTYLATARYLFNGAATYNADIVSEYILFLGQYCDYINHGGVLRTGVKPPLKWIISEIQPERFYGLEELIKRCICSRKHEEYIFYLKHGTDGCVADSTLQPLLKLYCELFWMRMEKFCAAAERQGMLKAKYKSVPTRKWYCAKSDCAKCVGTDPLSRPDLWQLTPMPLCQLPLDKD
jgi:hypothetical protein